MTQQGLVSTTSFRSRSIVWVGSGVASLLAAGTIALWMHFGGTVYFEMIVAGIAACF